MVQTQTAVNIANSLEQATKVGNVIGTLWIVGAIILGVVLLTALIFGIIKIYLLSSIKSELQNLSDKVDDIEKECFKINH